jgi:phosphotransferase system enzyme I (PtsI)
MILMDVMEDLEEEGLPFQRNIPVGMMVEVPSAVILAPEFAKEVDFFSIGTNDLIQYTLACDRSDPTVANLYRSGDPSILRLIQMVVQAADKHKKPVNVCGQMSSEPRFIPLLIGLGLKSLTRHSPGHLTAQGSHPQSLTGRCQKIAQHALSLDLAATSNTFSRESSSGSALILMKAAASKPLPPNPVQRPATFAGCHKTTTNTNQSDQAHHEKGNAH